MLNKPVVGTYCCSGCDQPTRFIIENKKLYSECSSCNAKWLANFSDLCMAITDVSSYLALPEIALNKVLDECVMRSCFGTMKRRDDRTIEPFLITMPQEVTSPEEVFAQIITDAAEAAKEEAKQLVMCSSCVLFDRCAVISGLMGGR